MAGEGVIFGELNMSTGGTVSDVLDTGNKTLCWLGFPAAFDGASITFDVATTAAGTLYDLVVTGGGADLTYTVAGGDSISLSPDIFDGVRYVRITSSATQNPAINIAYGLRDRN